MVSHSLAIAKASLAAGMIRPDPTSIPKPEIARFHTLLEAVLEECSSANIELCKDWLLKNVIPSAARTTAVGKYLVALSLSFAESADGDDQKPVKGTTPSAWRRWLHVLYLLNDVLHHTKYHLRSPSAHSTFAGNIQSSLADLFGAASSYSLKSNVRQRRLIKELLDIWEGSGYYQSSIVQKLRDTTSKSSESEQANTGENTKLSKEVWRREKKDPAHILPPSHGDPMTPFYDLPAANMIAHIVPNSAKSINPQVMKALQFTAGPPDEDLVLAVRDFLTNVASLDANGFEDKDDVDVDELGQSILSGETTGNFLGVDGYYGWSRAFCEKMKQRRVGLENIGKITGRAISNEGSLSPSRRRRCSDSGSRSKSQDRNFNKSRSSSLSSNQSARRRNWRRSTPKPRETSRESRRYRSLRSHSRSRSPSYSPPQAAQTPLQPTNPQTMQHNQARGPSPSPSLPFPHPFSTAFPPGPGGIRIPPPPPPNYHGLWPPPPPPPMPNQNSGDTMSAPIPPIGPRIGQDHVASAYQRGHNSDVQSQTPQASGKWNQQQFGNVGGYPYADRGSVQQPFNGMVQNGRGRGYGRRGWSR